MSPLVTNSGLIPPPGETVADRRYRIIPPQSSERIRLPSASRRDQFGDAEFDRLEAEGRALGVDELVELIDAV